MKLQSSSCLLVAVVAALLSAAPGCSSAGKAMDQSIAMIALNSVQPFASETYAKKVALLVLDDRYPKSVFLPQEGGTVVDGGDVWSVTFENSLLKDNRDAFPILDGVLLPRTLTFEIRKADAAIVDIR